MSCKSVFKHLNYSFKNKEHLFFILFVIVFLFELFTSSFLSWDLDKSTMSYLKKQSNSNRGTISFCIDAKDKQQTFDSFNKFGVQNASYISTETLSLNGEQPEDVCFIFTDKFKSNFLYNELGVLSVNEQYGWNNLDESSVFISQELCERAFGVRFISDFNDKYIDIGGLSYKVGGLYYSKKSKNGTLGDYYRKYIGEAIFVQNANVLNIKKNKICISFFDSNKNYQNSFETAKKTIGFSDKDVSFVQKTFDNCFKKMLSFKNSFLRVLLYVLILPSVVASIVMTYKIIVRRLSIQYSVNLMLFAFASICIPLIVIVSLKSLVHLALPIYLINDASLLLIFIHIIVSILFIYKEGKVLASKIHRKKYLFDSIDI